MIEINGKRLDEATTSPLTDIRDIMEQEWERLADNYGLHEGGFIKVDLKKEFMIKKQVSSEDGENYTDTVSYPSGVAIPLSTTINWKGTRMNVVYYENKVTSEKGISKYSPTVLMFKGSKSFSELNKELLMFLYLFSGRLEDAPKETGIVIENSHKNNMFYIYDEVLNAKNANDSEIKLARITMLVAETDVKILRKFAATIDIKTAKVHDDIVRRYVLNHMRDNAKFTNGSYEKLIRYKENYNEVSTDLDMAVRDAYENKMIKTKRTNLKYLKEVKWIFVEDNLEFYVQSNTEVPNVESVIDYLLSDQDEAARFLDRYKKFKS